MSQSIRRLCFSLFLAVLFAGGMAACSGEPDLPDPSSEAYREAVGAFYTGVAAIQVGEDRRAEEELQRAADLVPQEPAIWADLGLLALRRGEFEEAAERLERARALAPEDSRILLLMGLLETARGQEEEAERRLREAAELDPQNLKALHALARLLERRGRPAEARALLDDILEIQPNNTAVLVERARAAAADGDEERLREILARLEELGTAWPEEARAQLEAVRTAVAEAGLEEAGVRLAFLENVLRRLPRYRADLEAVQTPSEQVGDLITRLIRLPTPQVAPAPPDLALSFLPEPLIQEDEASPWAWAQALLLAPEGLLSTVVATGEAVWIEPGTVLPFPGGRAAAAPSPHGITALDYDYDFRPDLALAGAGGFRLYRQVREDTFEDVTEELGLSAALLSTPYYGVWTYDLDLEGDLDLVLAPVDGAPRVLRNRGDGTFEAWPRFQDVTGLRDFVWADLDADGDPDAALLDASGEVHLHLNDRSGGAFSPRPLPAEAADVLALSVSDLDRSGVADLLLLRADGAVQRLSGVGGADSLHFETVTTWQGGGEGLEPGVPRLFTGDLDNNAAVDLVVATPAVGRVWLQGEEGDFFQLDPPFDVRILGLADLSGEGRLDLLGVDAAGSPVRFVSQGTLEYHGKGIRPRAASAVGDQRINPFGLGGQVEVRSGLLFQQQPITSPVLHFGLGPRTEIDVMRIVWPNGDVQAEFELESDQMVTMRQRLKGSCPWLFTYDGESMRFVTDFIWRSPLGLAINAQETAGVMMTEDRVKISGDELVPRGDVYDLRITAELWETHFFDHVSLLVVDHPEETEIFIDERFAFPPPALDVHVVTPPQPVAGAWDSRGREVTDLVQGRDGQYVGIPELGPYQGVAEEHFLEIELGEEAPAEGPLLLVASGWVRPTDSSINVALAQGSQAPPQGLRLEVPDGQGGWTAAEEDLGFPAGKMKTVLLDLEGLFPPGGPRRLRLRTNLEIYWDRLAWAVPLREAETRTERLQPRTAELRYRGFSEVTEADRTSPEVPHYERLKGTAQVWRDLEGYYTRFGDVRELLEEVDDRYVIMNAGDELAFQFPAPPPPPEGWTRDFVLIGDGWVKDGDFNTAFSKTVLPLPAHDRPDYSTPPGALEDDPVYRRHSEDWAKYHTRYVTPDRFERGLAVRREASPAAGE